MMRLALCGLILIGGIGAGRALARPFCERRLQLQRSITLLQQLKEDLQYSRLPLAEALQHCGTSFTCPGGRRDRRVYGDPPAGLAADRLFQTMGRLMAAQPLQSPREAFEASAKQVPDLTLQSQDLQVFRDLTSSLGATDLGGQIQLLQRSCRALETLQKQAEEEGGKKERMYRALGTSGAVLLIILLI